MSNAELDAVVREFKTLRGRQRDIVTNLKQKYVQYVEDMKPRHIAIRDLISWHVKEHGEKVGDRCTTFCVRRSESKKELLKKCCNSTNTMLLKSFLSLKKSNIQHNETFFILCPEGHLNEVDITVNINTTDSREYLKFLVNDSRMFVRWSDDKLCELFAQRRRELIAKKLLHDYLYKPTTGFIPRLLCKEYVEKIATHEFL